MHLQLKPALCRVWRRPGTVQIGLDPRHGTVLDGLTGAEQDLIEELGSGVDAALLTARAPAVEGAVRTRELLRLLRDAGVLVGSRAGRSALSRIGTGLDRLTPDAEVWSVLHPGAGDGWEVLAARAGRRVEVRGAGRTGSGLAVLLTACGVGTVRVCDPRPVVPEDVTPAGATLEDVGRPREHAVETAAARIGRRTAPGRRPPGERPDLVVLVEDTVADAAAAQALLAADVPHLSVVIGEAGATVGPLVLPGNGPCLGCLELHRTDRDRDWPRVLAQLLAGRRDRSREETACAGLTAALACLQVLALLDGGRPAAVGATLEVELPDGLVSRREWPAHPVCGCHWPPAPPSPTGAPPDAPSPEADAPPRERARVGAPTPSAGRMPV